MISIIIPTYNEKKNISKILNILKKIKMTYEVVFVDDQSEDGTYNEIIKYKSKKIVGYLRKSLKKDLSKSVLFGIKKAKYSNILVMDCDLQHNPKYIFKMWNKYKLNNFDIIIANRFYKQKIIGNLGSVRSFISLSSIKLINIIFGEKTQDPLSGFFLCKKNKILKFEKTFFLNGYKILFDIIYNTNSYIKIKDIQINFKNRVGGKSKLSLKIILMFLTQIIYSKMR